MKLYNKNGEVIGELYGIAEPDEPKEPDTPDTPDEPEVPDFEPISTSYEKIKKIFNKAPESRLKEFYETFNRYGRIFRIANQTQENFFLAQIVAETGYELEGKRENLNYSCDALKKIFSRYKNNPKWAERDGRCNGHSANQVNIGNIAYADRIGNGSIESGDGYRFRGGGYFQLTGRDNYEQIAKVINKLTNENVNINTLADKIVDPKYATLSALAFWYDRKCYQCGDIDCVTEKINKYTDTYQKRKEIYQWIASI